MSLVFNPLWHSIQREMKNSGIYNIYISHSVNASQTVVLHLKEKVPNGYIRKYFAIKLEICLHGFCRKIASYQAFPLYSRAYVHKTEWKQLSK